MDEERQFNGILSDRTVDAGPFPLRSWRRWIKVNPSESQLSAGFACGV